MYAKLLCSASLALLLAACSPSEDTQSPAPPKPVHLLTIEAAEHTQVRRFPAVVEATQTAELAFRVGGEIKSLPYRPGQSVSQGTVVAALDPTDFELAEEQAAAQADLMRAQHARNQRMLDDQLISEAAFDQSRADLRVAEANLKSAQANLEYSRLKAPFDGVVANLHVEAFENISPQQPILTLQVDGLIDVSIRVPERLFARVRRNLDYQPDVLFDSMPGQFHKASIREWDRVADATTNTYRVVFSMPAPAGMNILPGMTASVLIDAAQMTEQHAHVVLLPAAAVFAPEDQPLVDGVAYVWVYQPTPEQGHGTLVRRRVQVGDMTNDGVQILDGLSAGEQVVRAGVHHLSQGQQVQPWVRERGL
jgi:RND family efflux transporter MFP subunit